VSNFVEIYYLQRTRFSAFFVVMASTTSDLALLGRKLGASDYNPDLYVKEIAQRCVGGHELLLQRNNIKVNRRHTKSISVCIE